MHKLSDGVSNSWATAVGDSFPQFLVFTRMTVSPLAFSLIIDSSHLYR